MKSARPYYYFVFTLLIILLGDLAYAEVIKPRALQPGDTVALITPSHSITHTEMQFARERLESLGLKVMAPKSLLEQYGQFAGTPQSRAKEINDAFKDPKIKALFAVRGGSGAGNVLAHLDYEMIRKNPKILIGFSDITALLIALHKQADLITFHGPVVGFALPEYTVGYLKAVLFDQQVPLVFKNPAEFDHKADLIQTDDRTFTLTPGQATGELIGGNLTVLTSLLGTKFLPRDWSKHILFIEDVDEDIYRIDVMLGQLQNAGILSQIKGLVFGTCTNCANNTFHSFRLEQVLKRYIQPLQIPAYYGALIGHQPEQFTLPLGAKVKLDATQGTLTLLEAAVA